MWRSVYQLDPARGALPSAWTVAGTLAGVGGKLLLLTVGGVLFAQSVEGRLGLSVALGGFFAGLLFSRDPRAVKVAASFDSLYDLFVPFFFVYVGFSLDPTSLVGEGPAVGLLLAAAVVGKGLGSFLPALRSLAPTEAAVFAVSLISRSEITLLVMQRGLDLGVVSPAVFGPVVAVVAITMVGGPLALQLLLRP